MSRITCHFQGRLGNLMFEAAAVVATAKRQGMTPCFWKEECQYYRDILAYRDYMKPILQQFEKWDNAAAFKAHEDNIHGYSALPAFSQDTMLRGFYTCSRYFNDYRKDIIELFTRRDKGVVEKKIHDLRLGYPGKQLVSVHVRRTDYVTDYGWALPLEYYQQAAQRFPGAVFVIFSDDIEWCKRVLTFMPARAYITERDFIELQMMGRLDGMIIANSTFSTWGAILGDPDMNKTVVAPQKWLPDGKGNHNHDIHEPHWVLL